MLAAALLELLPEADEFIDKLNTIGLRGVSFKNERSVKCGILGTHMRVTVNGESECEDHISESHAQGQASEKLGHENHVHGQHGRGIDAIEQIVCALNLPERVKSDIMAVYTLLAKAESAVHGVDMREIHFHEIGTMDAIADIAAVCLLIDTIGAQEIIASSVNVGSGTVKCAHGILPVPAPATLKLLEGIPIYSGKVRAELCTPTGAALLRHFVSYFGSMPPMKTQKIGYGMGKKDFEEANCVRALLGERVSASETGGTSEDKENDEIARGASTAGSECENAESGCARDEIVEMRCNIDDMTGEAIGFAMERLFEAGALDVYTMAIGMKRSRPGVLLGVICRSEDKERIMRAIFKHTSTIGIRECVQSRYILQRHIKQEETVFGTVRSKVVSGYGVQREKYEYEDIARAAAESGLSLDDVKAGIEGR